MEVNWEKMIVFSTPSDRSSTSSKISSIFRIFAESGGNELDGLIDFRRAIRSQSLQYFDSEAEFDEDKLRNFR